jgi:hypothetical protein
MDKLPPEKRSWLMGLVKGKHTNPEIIVRRIVSPVSITWKAIAGASRHRICFTEIRDLCEWLFLASARKVRQS